MKQIFILLSLLLFASTSFAQITSAGSGDWSNTATWVGNVVPSASSGVTIANGHTVTVDVDASCAELTNSGGTLTMGTGGTLHIGGNFLNNGTFTADSRPVEFNGVGLQTINGTPDGFGYVAFFNNLTINNSAGVKMLDKIRIWSSLALSTGQFDLNGKILRLDNVTLTRAGGTIVKNGGDYNLASTIDVVYTVPCTTGDEFLPSNLGNVTINVGAGNSVTMASSANAWAGLTLTSGNLVTGANTITLGYSGNMGSVNHTSGALVGNFKRWITNTTVANVIFPVGTSSKYRPAVVSFTSAPSVEGTITASYVASNPGTNGVDLSTNPIDDGGYSITKVATDGYWILTSGDGLTGGVYSVDITADGYAGISDYTKLRIVKRANASSNWATDGSFSAGTGSNSTPVAHRTGLSGFSEFGVGGNTADNPLPVELTSFTASVAGKNVSLQWNTATETNNYGFEVERTPLASPLKEGGIKGGWNKVGFVEGRGTANAPQSYGFNDALTVAGKYVYRLKQIDRNGKFGFSKEIEATVVFKPAEYTLAQNYPNPFNPTTVISYQLPVNSYVTLRVYDVLGKEIATLINGTQDAGVKIAQFNASQVPGGIYFYTLHANNFSATRKMLLVK